MSKSVYCSVPVDIGIEPEVEHELCPRVCPDGLPCTCACHWWERMRDRVRRSLDHLRRA